MRLEDVKAISAAWKRSPPAHVLLAGQMGYKPAQDTPQKGMDEAALRAYMAEHGLKPG